MKTFKKTYGFFKKLLSRKTTAQTEVYRITIQARKKTELFLKAIQPYVVGEKNCSRISSLLEICGEYNKWLEEGGKSKAASLAARSKHQKKDQKKDQKMDSTSQPDSTDSD